MEFNCKLIYRLPKAAIDLLTINEDTAFEAYFEDGAIVVRPLSDDEVNEVMESAKQSCGGDCDECGFCECCPYIDEEDIEDECREDECKHCEYYCHRCGRCILSEQED